MAKSGWTTSMVCRKCGCIREFVEYHRVMYCEVCDADDFVLLKYGTLPKIVQPSKIKCSTE